SGVTVYCFDTDVLSATMRRDPPLQLIRRLASVAPSDQCTTSITLGELVYGATKAGNASLAERVQVLVTHALHIMSFDAEAAQVYGSLRASLESSGKRLAEPDLRIASIALARDLTLVTGNVRHFARVQALRVENWLEG
ncbi:MAG: PIN domain-containing protein, partial [Actinomycetota bacterium]